MTLGETHSQTRLILNIIELVRPGDVAFGKTPNAMTPKLFKQPWLILKLNNKNSKLKEACTTRLVA